MAFDRVVRCFSTRYSENLNAERGSIDSRPYNVSADGGGLKDVGSRIDKATRCKNRIKILNGKRGLVLFFCSIRGDF
jgi:hypothetical protein